MPDHRFQDIYQPDSSTQNIVPLVLKAMQEREEFVSRCENGRFVYVPRSRNLQSQA